MPATTRFRALIGVPALLPAPLGPLAVALMGRPARWRWTCDRHAVEEVRAALGPGRSAESAGGDR